MQKHEFFAGIGMNNMEDKDTLARIIAEKINLSLPKIKSGTLRFYGEWFGRPMDNYHQIIKANNQKNLLIIHFDNNEILHINAPSDFKISQETFTIKKSKGLIWQWYLYGAEQVNENIRILNYIVNNEKNKSIISQENVLNIIADENEMALEIC